MRIVVVAVEQGWSAGKPLKPMRPGMCIIGLGEQAHNQRYHQMELVVSNTYTTL